MDADEKKQTYAFLTNLLSKPMPMKEKADTITDYMDLLVAKYRVLEQYEEIDNDKKRNVRVMTQASVGACSSCCSCFTCVPRFFWGVLMLTLNFMFGFFLLCTIVYTVHGAGATIIGWWYAWKTGTM